MQKKDWNMADLSLTLAEAGVKPSQQRLAIFSYLKTHYCHPTVDNIFAHLQKQMPTLSKTTVYNTVKILTEAGLVRQLFIDPDNQRFDGKTDLHNHFYCRKCGSVSDVENPGFQAKELPRKIVEKMEISFYGICEKCSSLHKDGKKETEMTNE